MSSFTIFHYLQLPSFPLSSELSSHCFLEVTRPFSSVIKTFSLSLVFRSFTIICLDVFCALMHFSCHGVIGTLESMCVFLFLVSFEKFSQVISSDTVSVPFSLLSPFWNYKYIHVNFFTASNRNPNLFFNFLSTFFSP